MNFFSMIKNGFQRPEKNETKNQANKQQNERKESKDSKSQSSHAKSHAKADGQQRTKSHRSDSSSQQSKRPSHSRNESGHSHRAKPARGPSGNANPNKPKYSLPTPVGGHTAQDPKPAQETRAPKSAENVNEPEFLEEDEIELEMLADDGGEDVDVEAHDIAPDASIETTKATFGELPIMQEIQRALKETGYQHPTPIQLAAIPDLLSGRDLLGCAQTGTGKTAAFAIPILQNLTKNNQRPLPRTARSLILTPTRELAIQINDSFKTYGRHLRLKTTVVFGGVGQGPQVSALKSGVDILVATPGRLLDLIQQKHLNLGKLEIFVLDEADRMLDMGFVHDVKKVIAMLPKERQSLFFSATMPNDIKKLADSMLTNPALVEVTPVSSTAEMIDQYVMYVEKAKKRDLLKFVLQQPQLKKVIVFTRTKRGANVVSEVLDKNGIASEAIHGNKSQNARQRALENFRSGKTRVLVATDIAARGIDIDEISHVINFEVPNVAESYVHRIGRTARAGHSGTALSFCDAEERSFIRDIEKLIGKPIPVATDHPYHSETVANARLMSSGKAKAAIEASEGGRGGRGGRRGGGRRGGFSGGSRSGGHRPKH